MEYLFSKNGQTLLQSLSFTDCLLAFDFDGTLSPIVSLPSQATLSQITERNLINVNQHYKTAIISGRSIEDLKKRIPSEITTFIGNHGLEKCSLKNNRPVQAEEICSKWKKLLLSNYHELFKTFNITLENKIYSLALHYRNSRNKKNAKIKLLEIIQNLTPSPRIILGKSVVNLIPSGSPHKGVAMLELMIELSTPCALYIGDDDTDEDVFSLPNSKIVTVRVGKKNDSQAQFYLKNQSEINKVLNFMIACKSNDFATTRKNSKNN